MDLKVYICIHTHTYIYIYIWIQIYLEKNTSISNISDLRTAKFVKILVSFRLYN
jgi:hypothetical protein